MTSKHFDNPEILGPEEAREAKVKNDFWKVFRKAARVVPFSDELVAAYFCALDPQTPRRVRGMLLAALAYFVVPLDFIPDFIIGIGFGDDMTVLAGTIALVASHITDRHREAARKVLADPEQQA